MAASDPNDIAYCFQAEWYDEQACVPRQYTLIYYLLDKTIAMNDMKANRMFLKRCKFPNITMKDLFIGATVTLNARQMTIKDFGNDFTRRELTSVKQSIVAVVKTAQFDQVGSIMVELVKRGLTVGRVKSVRLTAQQANTYGPSVDSRGPVVAIEVIGLDCAAIVAEILGEDFGSRSVEADLTFFFKSPLATSAVITPNVSIVIIKPHMLEESCEGELVQIIQREGLEITAIQRFNLDRQAAKEFLDIYFEVVPYANNLVYELQSGPCIAIEVRGDNVHNRLRMLVGPCDPVIAQYLRPNTIRAHYGKDVVKNAVHCTDLEGDGPLESDFLFNTVQASELIKAGCF